MAKQPALSPEEREAYMARAADCLTRPHRQEEGCGYFLLWMSKASNQLMIFRPETDEELRDAELFYQACYRTGPFARATSNKPRTKRTPEELALIRGYLNNREDTNRLLIYSDYLTEHDNPQGEFIRVCTEIDNTEDGTPDHDRLNRRWREMLDTHAEEWFEPLGDLGLRPELFGEFDPFSWMNTHGIIDSVTIDQQGVLPEKAKQLFEVVPFLREIRFEDITIDTKKLAKIKQFEQIESLGLSSTSLQANQLHDLLKSKHLNNLKELDVGYNPLGDGGFGWLFVTRFKQLTHLDVTHCDLRAGTTSLFHEWNEPNSLRELRIGQNEFSEMALEALLTSKALGQLEVLRLNDMELHWPIHHAGLHITCQDTLHSLDVSSCQMSRYQLLNLTDVHWQRLVRLNLCSVNNLSEMLAHANYAAFLAKLKVLQVDNCSLGATGTEMLSEYNFAELVELELSRNRIRLAGVQALCRGNHFPKLEKLNLWDNQLNAEAMKVLAKWKGLTNLRELDLHDNNIGVEGAMHLAESKHLKKLNSLSVSRKSVKKKGEAILLDRFGEEVVNFRD